MTKSKHVRVPSVLDVSALREVMPDFDRMSMKEKELMAFYAVGVPVERIAPMVKLKVDDVTAIIKLYDPDSVLPTRRNLQFALCFSQSIVNVVYFMSRAQSETSKQSPLQWMMTAKIQLEVATKLKELLPRVDEIDQSGAKNALGRLEGGFYEQGEQAASGKPEAVG